MSWSKNMPIASFDFFGTNRHLTQWHSYVHIPWYACRLNDSLTWITRMRSWLISPVLRSCYQFQESFVNGLRLPNCWVCIQFERYPALHRCHDHTMIWEWNSIPLPIFNHCSVTWHEYQILAEVLHMVATSTEGYYQVVLFNSGSGLLYNDITIGTGPWILQNYKIIYILWLAPLRPLPFVRNHTQLLGNLISEHFA